MRRVIEGNNTLLVDGPACLRLLTGSATVLGAALRVEDRVVVREGKRLPLEVRKRSTFDLTLGENASLEEVEGSTIPVSWERALKETLSHRKPVTVAVMGGVDSGKTSFCVFLANEALKLGHNVAIIDADMGQSDIGPPATIGLGRVAAPIKDLFELEAEAAYFVGLTSPSRALDRVLEGLIALKSAVSETEVNFLIVNTDGWIEGEDAVRYKAQLLEKIGPHMVVGMQQNGELAPILTSLKGVKILVVDSPPAIRRRSQEKRKILRELGYKKYLKEAKIRAFPLNRVNVEGSPLGAGNPPTAWQMEKVRDLLEGYPIYCEETPSTLVIVLGRGHQVGERRVEEIEDAIRKRVKIIEKGEEEGLLVALKDAQGSFLGIGVLSGVDYQRRAVKIYTSVGGDVATVHVGQMKIDKKGREIGLSTALAETVPRPLSKGSNSKLIK